MADDDGVLKRWSRRKSEARAPTTITEAEAEAERQESALPPVVEAEEPALPAEVPGEDEEAEPGDGEEAEIDPKDLPDIDSLDKDSDFTVFMRKGVPDLLKRAALRKLWLSDPVFGHIDGLAEYAEDFTAAADGIAKVTTTYKVGKGYASEDDDVDEDLDDEAEAEADAEDDVGDGESDGGDEDELVAESGAGETAGDDAPPDTDQDTDEDADDDAPDDADDEISPIDAADNFRRKAEAGRKST